ncbi:MAG: glycogen(starch) synthase [Desulforhopalus sp.]|jgi:glycogen(starch) synthase
MRIALLTSFFPPDAQTGIARYVEDLAFSLIAKGIDVTVIAAGSNTFKVEQRGHLTIYWVTGLRRKKQNFLPSIGFLKVSFKMRNILKKLHNKKPFDIIEYPNTEFTGILSILFGITLPRPHYIVRMASPMSVNPKKRFLPRVNGLLESWQAKLSDGYISHSLANLKVCDKIYQLPKSKPRQVIPLGLPQECFFAANHQPPCKKILILFLGHMERRKGFDVLASAWPIIATALPQTHLVVAGIDRPCEHGDSFFRWATRNMPPNALARMRYYGMVDSDLRDTLYNDAYICVVPSRYESFGLILLEAMRYRLPTVSSNVGGIPEVITDGQTGVLVPPNDHIALSNAIINLCQDNHLYNRIKDSLEKEFTDRFTIDRVAEQTHQFYNSL